MGDSFLDEICDLLDKYEVSVKDLLALVCSHLDYYEEDKYGTGICIGGNLYDIEIKRRKVQ